jgi:hypothetical protein
VFTASSTRIACRKVFGPELSGIPVHACLVVALRVVAHGEFIARFAMA